MQAGRLVADATPAQLLRGEGGETAQALVAVPRDQPNGCARWHDERPRRRARPRAAAARPARPAVGRGAGARHRDQPAARHPRRAPSADRHRDPGDCQPESRRSRRWRCSRSSTRCCCGCRGWSAEVSRALGFLPSLIALTLYALLPIIRNGVAGLVGIDPAVTQAADAVGMTPAQKLRLIEAPLALPVLVAGIRTAAVWTIGAATLSTTVGQPSLGDMIFAGLQTQNWALVLAGCIAAAGLALVTDALIGLIERGIAHRRRPLWIGALIALVAGLALATAPLWQRNDTKVVTIGAKNFSEQYILARLIGDRLTAPAIASAIATASARRSSMARSPATMSTSTSIMPARCGTARCTAATCPIAARWSPRSVAGKGQQRRTPDRPPGLRKRLCLRDAGSGRQGARDRQPDRPRRRRARAQAWQRPRIPRTARMGGGAPRLSVALRCGQVLRADLHVPRARQRRGGRHLRLLLGWPDRRGRADRPHRSEARHSQLRRAAARRPAPREGRRSSRHSSRWSAASR